MDDDYRENIKEFENDKNLEDLKDLIFNYIYFKSNIKYRYYIILFI